MFSSITTRILCFVIVNLPKVFTSTYGVKNFYEGVKNFWHRPPFLPCGTYEKKKGYDLDLKIHILVKWHLTTTTSFFPLSSKVFYPIDIFEKIISNFTHQEHSFYNRVHDLHDKKDLIIEKFILHSFDFQILK